MRSMGKAIELQAKLSKSSLTAIRKQIVDGLKTITVDIKAGSIRGAESACC